LYSKPEYTELLEIEGLQLSHHPSLEKLDLHAFNIPGIMNRLVLLVNEMMICTFETE
jgi:hypothetical protein